MKRIAILLFCVAPLTACVDDVDTSATDQALDPSGQAGGGEPPDARVHLARDHAHTAGGGAGTSTNLVSHGGTVMTTGAYVEPIFWGKTWNNPGDKITGIQSFYAGMGGSPYDATNSEYTSPSGAHVGSGVTLGPTHIDLSAAPKNGNRTSPILSEVCAQISNPRADGYYPVYVDTARGGAGFCAWHSAGTCGGVTVQFAFFFKLDGDSGCDPADTSGQHSQGLAAIANVSGHELSETLTDPHLDAWYDPSGAENSDKCAWRFGTPLLTFSNGSQWKIQGNWSNAAFNGGTGYANSGGEKGCLDGGNYR